MKKFFASFIIAFAIISCDSSITINTSKGRYIASDHLSRINGKESISKGVKELLHEEQNLHNKDLWGASAFSSNINPDYVPEKNPKFPLPYYLIPEDEAKFLHAMSLDEKVASQLMLRVSGKKHFKLFVHPESEAHYEFLKNAYRYIGPEETEFTASPTSSYRSLVVWNHNDADKKPFIAKVSLDKNVIGSIDRLVSENEVERSVANQKVLDSIGKNKLEAMNVKVYPESAGLVIKKDIPGAPEKLGGQLIREIPNDVVDSKAKWFSFSALMSPNKNPPVIMSVIKASGLSSEQFFDKYMIDGYLDMFEKLSLQTGMNFEPHSQNLCFETTTDLMPTGKWVLRDFGGVWPDVITMARNKGPVETYMEEANATKFKLRGGRGNYISSYVFFYKRQVFDMMIQEVAKHDPEMTKEVIQKLKAKIDARYVKQINTYLGLKRGMVPTMSDYKTVEDEVIQKTKMSDQIAKKEIPKNQSLELYIKVKKSNHEWVSLSGEGKKTKFYLTDHGVYELDGDRMVGFGLFNQNDLAEFKEHKGTIPRLFGLGELAPKTSCLDMIANFFR